MVSVAQLLSTFLYQDSYSAMEGGLESLCVWSCAIGLVCGPWGSLCGYWRGKAPLEGASLGVP